MPRQKQGARLYRRANGTYTIRDSADPETGERARELSTGTKDRREAEAKLAQYIDTKKRGTVCGHSPTEITVAEIMEIYAREQVPQTKPATQKDVGFCIAALVPRIGHVPLAHVNAGVCRRYQKLRNVSQGTVRKELSYLQAAINFCHVEGYISQPVKIKRPSRPAPRDRWLSRDEVAKMIRAARRDPSSKHLAKFILVAIYTGSRSSVILNLQFMPNTQGGWIDTSRGIMHRRFSGEIETKKRKPPIPIPAKLLGHLRRWEKTGSRYVIDWGGLRVGEIGFAWRAALKVAGIDHATKHDLRRTCATWLMQAGADKWAVSGFLGMSLQTLETTYGHHHPDHLKSAVDAFDHGIGKLAGNQN